MCFRLKANTEERQEQKREFNKTMKVERPEEWAIKLQKTIEWKANNPEAAHKIANKAYHNNKHKQSNINNQRDAQYKYKYGISIEEYDSMYIKQGGRCAICGKHQSEVKHRLCVDHSHKTNNIRGLLCKRCNTGLGMFSDKQNILTNAIRYLDFTGE